MCLGKKPGGCGPGGALCSILASYITVTDFHKQRRTVVKLHTNTLGPESEYGNFRPICLLAKDSELI